jgi:hypothetical protein
VALVEESDAELLAAVMRGWEARAW